jgi:hypothetical protein
MFRFERHLTHVGWVMQRGYFGVIASEAKQSIAQQAKYRLLRYRSSQ